MKELKEIEAFSSFLFGKPTAKPDFIRRGY